MNTGRKQACVAVEKIVSPVFEKLTEEDWHILNRNKTCVSYSKGQNIFLEETQPLGLYYLENGIVIIWKNFDDKRKLTVHLVKEGDMLDYHSLFAEKTYGISAMALENSVI